MGALRGNYMDGINVVGIPATLEFTQGRKEGQPGVKLTGLLTEDGDFYYPNGTVQGAEGSEWKVMPDVNKLPANLQITLTDSRISIARNEQGNIEVIEPQSWTERGLVKREIRPEYVIDGKTLPLPYPASLYVGQDVRHKDPDGKETTTRVQVVFEAAKEVG